MLKCYIHKDNKAGDVIIPNCWNVVHSNNIADCTCGKHPQTFAQFERKEFNDKLKREMNTSKNWRVRFYACRK